MANATLTPTVIAREAILVLINNMVFANLVHREYDTEFRKIGDTITLRNLATFVAEEWNGSTVTIQNATEAAKTLQLDKIIDVSFAVTSKELSLDIVDFSEQFIQPAMRAHAQKLDELIAARYVDFPYYKPVGGTPALADVQALNEQMNVNKVPRDDQRYLVVGPTTESKYVILPGIVELDKSGSAAALRNATIGRIFTMQTFMDQNIVSHTKGVPGGTPDATGSSGATSITIANGGAAGTYKQGDIITIDGISGTYVILADVTLDGMGDGTATIYPGLASAASGDAITLVDTDGPNNLAFHRKAIALGSAPLAPPMGAAFKETIQFNGISARVTAGYNQNTKSDTISIDFLVGVKTIIPELGVRLID